MSKLNLTGLDSHFFPEEFYPPVSQDYGLRCSQGLQIASESDVLICGVVRDADFILNRNLTCLLHIGGFFRNSSIFIYENDSQDSTRNILDKYSQAGYINYKTDKLETEKLEDTSLVRRINMANARNEYLKFAQSIKDDIQLLIVVDLDLLGGWSYTGLMNSLSHMGNDSKKCFGSNSIMYRGNERLYYDTYAYLDSYNYSETEKNLMRFNRGEDPIPVNSCFGGMVIYPASILDYDIKYETWNCDHITLHEQLRVRGYQVYLNPSQITLYSTHYYANSYNYNRQ